MSYLSILPKVVPVLFLLTMGYIIKLKEFISARTIEEMKQLVVNISLPAVLFLAFLDVNFKREYLLVILVVILVNILMLILGNRLAGVFKVEDPYFPLLFTGFEVGMLGIPLFGAIYGMKNIKFMGVVDIGQELYVWFILLGIIFSLRSGEKNYKSLFRSFITSPIIIAIFLGIIINSSGLASLLSSNTVYVSLINSIDLIASLTIPLILLIIGYEINFNLNNLELPAKIIGLRLIILLPLALILNRYVFTDLLNLDKMYKIALTSMFILPPPFVIPLFIRDDKNRTYIFNTLSLGTVVSITVYIILAVIYGAGL